MRTDTPQVGYAPGESFNYDSYIDTNGYRWYSYISYSGQRRYVDIESVWAYNQLGGISTSINVADLFKKDYYVMKFDENGNPDWSQRAVGV